MSDIKNYFQTSSKTIEKLSKFEDKILCKINEIIEAKKNQKKMLVAGNGGSCSDAEHFVENCNVPTKIGLETQFYYFPCIYLLQ